MKRITLTLGIAVLALGLASSSMAQDAGPSGGAPKTQVTTRKPGWFVVERQILSKLNLTREQIAKVRLLVKETQAKQKAMREEAKATLDKQDLRAKRKALIEGYETGLATILTADQETQYKELRKEYAAKEKAAKTGTIPPQG